jgi:hypothetical protein
MSLAAPRTPVTCFGEEETFDLVDGRQRRPDAWQSSFGENDVEGMAMAETVLAGVLATISSPFALAYPGARSWRFNDVLCWNFPEAQKLITKLRREQWRKANHTPILEAQRKYRGAHPEEIAAARKEWKRENPGKVKAQKSRRAFRDYERPFVAIDFEGRTFLDDDVVYPLKDGERVPNSATYPKHRIILGGAGGWARANDPVALARIEKEGETDAAEKARHAALMREGELLSFEWLYHDDERPLTSIETIEWLLSLPKKFGDVNFVAFVFNYDVTQILAELPRATVFEVCKSRKFDGSPHGGQKFKSPVFYGPYAIRYIKSKIFELWRLADPNKPYKLKMRSDGRPFLDKKGKPVKTIDASEHIAIHDTWGFWQKPFTAVSEALAKDGYFDAGDHETIVKHKANRSHFASTPIEEIRHYCGLELHALSKAATVLRDCFDKVPTGEGRDPGLRLRAWCGAGSASSALFRKVGLKKDHFPDEEIAVRTADIPEFQTAAFHGYFGGNIQLMKQGYAPKTPMFGYDLSSAYPWGCLELPSMKGGKWTHDKKIVFLNDTFVRSKETVANSNVLDMFRVRWCFPLGPKPIYNRKTREYDRPRPFPFFALPYRKTNGGILFPAAGLTWIMRDELLGAMRWVETFFPDPKAREQISDFTILETWRFTPATDEKPFAFVAELYAARGRYRSPTH